MSVRKIVPWIIQSLPSNWSLILLLIRFNILYASNSISILFNCKIYLLLHNFSWIWLSTPCLNLEYVSLSSFKLCVKKLPKYVPDHTYFSELKFGSEMLRHKLNMGTEKFDSKKVLTPLCSLIVGAFHPQKYGVKADCHSINNGVDFSIKLMVFTCFSPIILTHLNSSIVLAILIHSYLVIDLVPLLNWMI